MSYVDKVIQPGERIAARATIHWVTYLSGLIALIAGFAVYIAARQAESFVLGLDIIAVVLAVLGVVLLLRAWFRQWGTEIAVTDRRVIYKSGVVSRRTLEMNMDKVEAVEVDQSVVGRMFGYGDISVRGTGESIENIRTIADPLTIRSAITAR